MQLSRHRGAVSTQSKLSIGKLLNPIAPILVALWASAVCAGQSVTEVSLEAEAEALTQRFVGELKPALQKAMREGGPSKAIEVCASLAPRIANAMSAESGWLVRRVSLNPRNVSRAQPDNWERGVLQEFDRRRAAGEAPAELVYSDTVQNHYRYMRAQVAEGICLSCHGTTLSEAAVTTLSNYYPDDAATGYSLGQVRGAISLMRKVQQE